MPCRKESISEGIARVMDRPMTRKLAHMMIMNVGPFTLALELVIE
jgi:hypothetical protein